MRKAPLIAPVLALSAPGGAAFAAIETVVRSGEDIGRLGLGRGVRRGSQGGRGDNCEGEDELHRDESLACGE